MSHNSKSARLHAEARTRNRVKGFKGPATTESKHGKAKSNRIYMNGKQRV